MADAVPPATPTQLQLSTLRSAPVAAPGPVVAVKAQVREAPASLKQPDRHYRVEGRVTSSNPEKKELRIATKEGEVVVQSDAALPPDTEVSLDLLTQKAQTLATITILKKQDEAVQELLKAVDKTAAVPQLKEGDKVIALQLPEETPPPALPQTKITLQEAAKIIEQMKTGTLPAKIPLPPEILIALAKSKDVLATLQKLPPDQQQAVTDYLQTRQPPADGPAPKTEVIDKNIFNIIKAQVSARITRETVFQPAAATLETLNKIFPFIENTSSVTDTMPAYIRQFMPQEAMAQIQQKNFVQLTVQKIIPPDTPAAKMPLLPVQQNAPLLGKVEALTPSGFPLISTEAGGITQHFVFKSPATVEVGSTILFQIQPMTLEEVVAQTQPATTVQAAPASSFDPLTSTTWPALQEALHVLSQSPQAAAVKNTLPSATPKFTPTSLFFLAALRNGTIESWLGANALQTLKDAGKKDIAEKLGGDFGRISSQSKEPLTGEWRMISMPMLHDEQLTQLQFFVRHQQDEENKEGNEKNTVTRFILNLQLSRMGDMQIDGLLRKKQFDLILRTADSLPLDMRQELMQAFAKGLEQANMQGGIGFQVKRDHWVNVELQKHAETVA